MSASGSSRLRGYRRAAVLFFSLLQCLGEFLLLRLRGKPAPLECAYWLRRSCKLVLRRLAIEVTIIGPCPHSGLIVSNHLSYLDIPLYSSAVPCAFVAKSEVRNWPLLGLLARMGGSIFIDRASASSAATTAVSIERLLTAGVPVLLFPEGTSSDGAGLLRFHAPLFEPAIRAATPITAAAVSYSAGRAATEAELCYHGDLTLVPHLLYTLGLPRIDARIQFSPYSQCESDRKSAASRTWKEVLALRTGQR